jgi:hypothetical protein
MPVRVSSSTSVTWAAAGVSSKKRRPLAANGR